MSEADTVTEVTGTGIPVRGNDIDTDQIIPARFLKALTFERLGDQVFYDQRFEDDGAQKDHPFNAPQYQDASILVVNANFGCGSSREHAPQALMRWGIDAIVGESFAEIFAGNCLALGIPTVEVDHEQATTFQDFIEANPSAELQVDVAGERVRYDDVTVDAEVDEGQRKALVDGMWDTTALLRSNQAEVRATAEALPYIDG